MKRTNYLFYLDFMYNIRFILREKFYFSKYSSMNAFCLFFNAILTFNVFFNGNLFLSSSAVFEEKPILSLS